jgi:hypothetical protein
VIVQKVLTPSASASSRIQGPHRRNRPGIVKRSNSAPWWSTWAAPGGVRRDEMIPREFPHQRRIRAYI